ncbi:hypothetical protein [Streptomyces sp. NPDC060002]|uniref:hypothetical protein n=1 Tax=Streptomyces sp. NPDC060002 TaxID=3347033 RepID=UPI0036B4A3B7
MAVVAVVLLVVVGLQQGGVANAAQHLHTGDDATAHRSCRLSTETKAAFKTTEFFVYIAAVVAVLIASMVVGDDEGHADYFRADKAWL